MKNKRLVNSAISLRRNQTDAEKLLWNQLKTRQLEDIKFRRQQPIGNFIVDFVSFEKRIIVEVDGGQHSEENERNCDLKRDKWLQKQGYTVLRFWNNEVLRNIEGVLEVIKGYIDHPPPTPPIKGGE